MIGKRYDPAEIAVIREKIDQMAIDVREIKDKLEKNYVTMERYLVVERLVYGLVAIVLIAVIGSLLKLVMFS